MAVFAAGFPESPKPGQIYTNPENGVQYKWNGSAWDIISTGGGGDGGSGGGGGDGSCPDTCIQYTDDQVEAEAKERGYKIIGARWVLDKRERERERAV